MKIEAPKSLKFTFFEWAVYAFIGGFVYRFLDASIGNIVFKYSIKISVTLAAVEIIRTVLALSILFVLTLISKSR